MNKPTQAHLSRTVNMNQPGAVLQQTKRQMKYYMGAKLIEIGVDPKSALYRWSVSTQGSQHVWTISAYWDESKDKLLSGEIPLTDIELINCARANAAGNLGMVAKLCGYGEDITAFQEALTEAAHQMGLKVESLKDLLD
jgi:hypothetical protein